MVKRDYCMRIAIATFCHNNLQALVDVLKALLDLDLV